MRCNHPTFGLCNAPPNARINAAGINNEWHPSWRMKAPLFPLALNELLGFIHRSHSVLPQPSMLVLSFNVPSASWRFNSPKQQLSILV
jgi:hypothetical protein